MSTHKYCEYNCGGTECVADERPRIQATVKLDEISREAVNKMDEIVKKNRRIRDFNGLSDAGKFWLGYFIVIGLVLFSSSYVPSF